MDIETDEFLAGQVADPRNLAITFIHADREEECGDGGLASFLRGLAAEGLSSLDFFLIQGRCDVPLMPDFFDGEDGMEGCGSGYGDFFSGSLGAGSGDEDCRDPDANGNGAYDWE